MNAEPDLFAYGENNFPPRDLNEEMMDCYQFGKYPNAPGHKGTDTGLAAAQSVDANTLRARVLAELRKAPGTADEIAARLGLSILSTRPRLTELKRMGRIIDTGTRRPNASGRSAAVFRLAA